VRTSCTPKEIGIYTLTPKALSKPNRDIASEDDRRVISHTGGAVNMTAAGSEGAFPAEGGLKP
jgi:hypothetical protein